MATHTFSTILTALMSALTGSSSLSAQVSTRIYQGWPPGKVAAYPLLVVWQEDIDTSARLDQGPTSLYDFGLALEAAAYSPDTLRTIDGILDGLLNVKGLTATGWRNVTAYIDGSTATEENEGRKPVLYRRVWTLRVEALPA